MVFGKLGAGLGRLGALGGAGIPPPPTGFIYLRGADGSILKGSNGALLLTPSGLVGIWSLDTLAALDTSGNANNGTAVGSPTIVAGQVGNAFNLTGANYIHIPNSALYDFRSGGYSYAFWIKGTAASQPGFQGFLSKGEASNDFALSRDSSTTALVLFHGATGLDFPFGTHTALLNGSFNHCAVTYDGTTATLYINGSSAGAITIGPPTYTNTFTLYLGAARTGAVSLVGILDDFKLWNRNLSSSEVLYDYNAGVAGQP